jgi:hypothetical protein
MPKRTAAQMKTDICCALGSFMRGTFRASAIVAKERIASAQNIYQQLHQKQKRGRHIHIAATICVSIPYCV